MVIWVVAGVAVVLALAAHLRVRLLSRRLARLSQSYWELRYEQSQLRDRLAETPAVGASDVSAPPRGASPSASAFVPLSSIRR